MTDEEIREMLIILQRAVQVQAKAIEVLQHNAGIEHSNVKTITEQLNEHTTIFERLDAELKARMGVARPDDVPPVPVN